MPVGGNRDRDRALSGLEEKETDDWHDVEASGGTGEGAGASRRESAEGPFSAESSVTSSSYTSDAQGMEDMHDFISNTYEVNLSSQNAGHMHVQEVADILEFPLSPMSDMVSKENRRRNLSPQRVMGSRQRRVQQQGQNAPSPRYLSQGGSSSHPQLQSTATQPGVRALDGADAAQDAGGIDVEAGEGERSWLQRNAEGSYSYGSTDR